MNAFKKEVSNDLEKQITKLVAELPNLSGQELENKMKHLALLQDALEKVNKPKLSKEEKAELIKVLGMAGLLCLAIVYDANGHVLPRALEKWIPGIKP